MPWAVPVWNVNFPAPNGTLIFNVDNFTATAPCENHRQSDPWCQDLVSLNEFLLSYARQGELTGENVLRTYPDDSNNWHNSSWAADVTFQRGSRCSAQDLVGETPTTQTYPVEGCQLIFNLPICVVIIVCNVIKAGCMLLTAREDRTHILLTVGDAISSFLTNPDPMTRGRWLMSKSSVARGPRPWQKNDDLLGRPFEVSPTNTLYGPTFRRHCPSDKDGCML